MSASTKLATDAEKREETEQEKPQEEAVSELFNSVSACTCIRVRVFVSSECLHAICMLCVLQPQCTMVRT